MDSEIIPRGGEWVTACLATFAGALRHANPRNSISRLVLGTFLAVGAWAYTSPAIAHDYVVSSESGLRSALGMATFGDSITFTADITITSDLPVIYKSLTINGNGKTLSGGGTARAFNVYADTNLFPDRRVTLEINDLTIADAKVVGGKGGDSSRLDQKNNKFVSGAGGGGGGLGGGLYVGAGADVTLTNVAFSNNLAKGGDGGSFKIQGGGGGAGGGGTRGDGGEPLAFGHGGYGGAGYGGAGRGGDGASSNLGGGGAYPAKNGGIGGGGGGAGTSNGPAGNGGIGGGGGGNSSGGGFGSPGQGGFGGIGGGNGAFWLDAENRQDGGGGGGGGGVGGAIFVESAGSLVLKGNLTIAGNQVAGGAGGGAHGKAGTGAITGIFLQGSGMLTLAPGAGQVQRISDEIGTETGVAAAGGDYYLYKEGEGTTILTGRNRFTDLIQIEAGTLQGNAASLSADIENNATLIFDQSVGGTYAYNIAGTGILFKEDAGTLTLTGNNTYTGRTGIQDGTLILGSSTALHSSSLVTLDGGMLGVENTTFSLGNKVEIFEETVRPSGFYAGTGGRLEVNGVVSGGHLTKTGAGDVVLNASNTFDGATVAGGRLLFSTDANLGAALGTIILDGGYIGTTSSAPGGQTIQRSLELASNGGIDVAQNTLIWSGQISGDGTFVKTGEGTLRLTNANAYSGGTAILGGTLRVTADNGLGKAKTALNIAGGTLWASTGFQSDRPVTLGIDGGAFRVSDGEILTLSGEIGGGGLIKYGEGTLELRGESSTYTGPNTIYAGTLAGQSNTIRGDVAFVQNSENPDPGVLLFNQTKDGTFKYSITGGGSLVKDGAATLTLAGASRYTGGTTVNAGTLKGSTVSLQGDILNNSALVFDQSFDGSHIGELSGSGTLTKQGTGRVALTGQDSAGGGTVINGGTLAVNGKLTSNVTVNKDGILAGAGNVVGNIDVNGGAIAPGNSIGTVHISGDLTMEAESDYYIEINGAASDRIDVDGKATILSSRFEIARYGTANAPVVPGTTYTILTTGGGLTVQSPTVAVADFPFISFELSEDGFNGYLTTARSDESFADYAATPNEIAVANALDAALGTAAWQQVVGASTAQAEAAFSSLANASIHASALGVLSEQSHFLRDAMIDRLREAIPGAASPTVAGVTKVPSGTAYAIWGRALGSWGARDGDGNTADISDSIGGMISGVDVTVDDIWRFGIAGGYSQTSFSSSDIAASGSSDSYHLALYAGWQDVSGFALRGGAAYSWNNVDTTRHVAVVGLAGPAEASYDAPTAQIFGEGAYKFAYGAGTFEPFANLAYVHIDSDINETGTAAMFGSSELDTTYTTLGVRASAALAAGLTVRGTLGWRHAFGDVTPEATLGFQPGAAAFSLAGVPIAENALVTELGIDFAVSENATLGLSYSGQYATDAYENSAQANFSLTF